MKVSVLGAIVAFFLFLSGLSLAASKPVVAVRGIELSVQNVSCKGLASRLHEVFG